MLVCLTSDTKICRHKWFSNTIASLCSHCPSCVFGTEVLLISLLYFVMTDLWLKTKFLSVQQEFPFSQLADCRFTDSDSFNVLQTSPDVENKQKRIRGNTDCMKRLIISNQPVRTAGKGWKGCSWCKDLKLFTIRQMGTGPYCRVIWRDLWS